MLQREAFREALYAPLTAPTRTWRSPYALLTPEPHSRGGREEDVPGHAV